MPLQNMSAGKSTFRWLSKIARSQPDWFLGSLQGRDNFSAWMVLLADGFRKSDFLLKFESTSDPWTRSKLVGEKISELRKSFARLTTDAKLELATRGDTDLNAGMDLLGRAKRATIELL